MEQRLSLVTLGVQDLVRSKRFYEALGWKASPKGNDNVVFFQMGGVVIGLYGRDALAEDAHVDAKGTGFRGITLAHNVRDKESVALVLRTVETAGAKIVKQAQDVFWGGHSGYFADPDGHLWEVAWNPFAEIDAEGHFFI